ncbi:DUF2851 family protein [Rufibacter glacialis]|uniref:DUF2851 family protein n=1 Tax=Rufibacter glacialis TaxID=1259555 RepID=A0A5M8QN03_9BACT|nr:DUF2851 family protein [Rufibacter glacialis]KAA6435582.1 DUF2851 family protein [Rufibacter glacialis]GGK64736.1 hypothetical protein GCM10011405_10930 [Rufibacter glacialis]
MKEDFLHYVWRFQYYKKEGLVTTAGQEVVVLQPGLYNKSDAGPDFFGARVRVGPTEWVGSVEIHLKASDWRRHQHHQDAKYNQVVLHVVWENDAPVYREDGSEMPTLELRGRVALPLQAAYQELLWSQEVLPCAAQASSVDPVYKSSMMDQALLSRLEVKAGLVLERLAQNRQDWESTVYQTLAAGFGFKINQEAFLQLTQVLPWNIANKYRPVPKQLEALVFGQAGLLTEKEGEMPDPNVEALQKEHHYLRQKHSLSEPLPRSAWNFLRLRPANFPAVRLGQWYAVLRAHPHLWSAMVECSTLDEYFRFFKQTAPSYWQTHTNPGKMASRPFSIIGSESIQGLLINVVAPLLVAYSRRMDNATYQEKAVELLETLPKEQNKVTRLFTGLGFPHRSAADSQALLGLHHAYCAPRKCVHCAIGHRLMKQNLSLA